MGVGDGDRYAARREQAQINAEKAAARRLEADLELRHIKAAHAAADSGDAEAQAAAAAALHRVHALHEAKNGHIDRARGALRRAAAVERRLRSLRLGRHRG